MEELPCFQMTDMEVLVVERHIIEKERQPARRSHLEREFLQVFSGLMVLASQVTTLADYSCYWLNEPAFNSSSSSPPDSSYGRTLRYQLPQV